MKRMIFSPKASQRNESDGLEKWKFFERFVSRVARRMLVESVKRACIDGYSNARPNSAIWVNSWVVFHESSVVDYLTRY